MRLSNIMGRIVSYRPQVTHDIAYDVFGWYSQFVSYFLSILVIPSGINPTEDAESNCLANWAISLDTLKQKRNG